MKPAFALSLSQDGIVLLHRTDTGWQAVAAVNPEADGLDSAMGRMAEHARALEPAGFTTKLVLPTSQILFTDIDAPGPDRAARRAQIAQALEGRTPYRVSDLVFDWSGNGRVVKAAVVAKVTLEEAETFAEHYGLRPVCFVADPDAGSFAGEPWFGQTDAAPRHLPDGERVTRDQDPVGIARLMPEIPPVATQKPVDAAAEDIAARAGTAASDGAEAPFIVVEDEDTGPAPQVVATTRPRGSDGVSAALTPTMTSAEAAPLPGATDTLIESVTAGRIDTTGDAGDWLDPPATVRNGAGAASAVAATAFASRRTGTDVASGDQPQLSALATRIDIVAPPVSAAPRLGAARHGHDRPDSMASDMRVGATRRADGAPRKTTGAARGLRRVLARATGSAAPKPKLRHPPKAPEAEAVELTVFGARRSAAVRSGRSRYMGVMLTAGLLLFMAGVGLWSLLTEDTATPVAAGAGTSVAVEPATVASDAVTTGTGDGVVADPSLDLAVVEPDPEADVTPPADDPAAAEAAAAEAAADATTTGEVAADRPAEDVVPAAAADAITAPAANSNAADPAAEAAVAAAAATLAAPAEPAAAPATPPEPAQAAAPSTGGTTAAKPAVAAAPSLWGASPKSGTAPEPDDTAVLRPDMNDPPKTGVASALPSEQALTQDPNLATQALPVPFDQLVRYDAAGLIIPTPQGVVAPEGFTVYAGRPKVVAKVRPATLKPPVTAVEIPLAPVDPAAVEVPNPLLGKKPLPRPAGLVVVRQGSAAVPEVAAPVDAVPADAVAAVTPEVTPSVTPVVVAPAPVAADPRLAGLKPKDRPARIAAVAAAAAEARTAIAGAAAAAAAAERAAGPNTRATRYAVASSQRPAERPSRLSQSVEAALALAVTTDAADATPTDPAPVAEPAVETAAASDPAAATVAALPVDEPEPVQATPNIPTRASVAKQATIANVMDLGRVNLIGVYGASGDRRAMVRMPSGRFVKVKIGDTLDGGRVAAISDTALSYVKGGRTIVLKMIRDS